MRPTPGPIPQKMPDLHAVAMRLSWVITDGRESLAGLSVNKLLKDCRLLAMSSVWMTGSTVWMEAVFGEKVDSDIDLIFEDRLETAYFVKHALEMLNGEQPPNMAFHSVTNALGGSRIVDHTGKTVMDCWHLENGASIHETVLAYPGGDHIHCAFLISDAPRSADVIRIVRSPFGQVHEPVAVSTPNVPVFGPLPTSPAEFNAAITGWSLGTALAKKKMAEKESLFSRIAGTAAHGSYYGS